MNGLVTIKNDVPVVSTADIYKRLGYSDHRNLKETIEKHIESFAEFGVMRFETVKQAGEKGGRPTKVYLLNEEQFTLLAMLMKNTAEVVALKVGVAKEFLRMRRTLANIVSQRNDSEWQNVRNDGKQVYMQKSNAVKDFVEYAKAQGSTSAERYYTNLATMENRALFFIECKYKNLREIMTIKQLMQVATADDVIEKALKEGMEQRMNYKDIYKLARDRVVAFAEIIGKSHVHALQLEVSK